MAGLKKPTKKKDTSRPNLVLVIFLVFFVLLAIGLGTWGYYGYAGQEKFKADAKSANTAKDVAAVNEDYHRMLSYEFRMALGDALNADEKTDLGLLRDQMKDGGKFKDMKTREQMAKVIEQLSKTLDRNDQQEFKNNYKALLDKVSDDLKKMQGLYTTAQVDLKASDEKYKTLETRLNANWKTALQKIQQGNDDYLKSVKGNTDEFGKVAANNRELTKQLADLNTEMQNLQEKFRKELKRKDEEIATFKQERVDNQLQPGRRVEEHALLLDISRGKPLWDTPLGKITRVNVEQGQVGISLGSADGIKPELTFNVFGAGATGRAEKQLKGTIEVIRVIDAHSSVARITSLYDETGREILFNDLNRGRAQREAEGAMREGDLLFNMIWGSRVAIAGYVGITSQASESPTEQMRQLNDFMYLLQKHGMIVDAYLDLTDGTVKGAVSAKTRYFIRGEDLRADPKDEVRAERAKLVNDGIQAMRKESIDRGMFIISAENLGHVVGYRRPRGANQAEASTFIPSIPFAGTVLPPQNAPARPPVEVKN
jgi:hypothetical protein